MARRPRGGGTASRHPRERFTPPRPRLARRVLAWLALAAFAVALLSLYLVATRLVNRDTPAGMPVTAPPMASVAVLPFVDLSPQRDQGYFSDGLAEEILNALSAVDGLNVTGRTSSFSFRGKSEDARTIGQSSAYGRCSRAAFGRTETALASPRSS